MPMMPCEQPYCALQLDHAGPCSTLSTSIGAHDDAIAAAERCGIREGETLAELILRLHSETLDDE